MYQRILKHSISLSVTGTVLLGILGTAVLCRGIPGDVGIGGDSRLPGDGDCFWLVVPLSADPDREQSRQPVLPGSGIRKRCASCAISSGSHFF